MSVPEPESEAMAGETRRAGSVPAPEQPPARPGRRSIARRGREHSPETAPEPSREDRRQGDHRQGAGASGHADASTGPSSIAEWITLAISSLIVFGLIGLTSYFYLTGSDAPPAMEVEPRPGEMYEAGGRYYLPVTVRNTGGTTGEEVRVRVTVTDATGRRESAEFQEAFLAGGGISRAVVAFPIDPRQGQIEAGVVSYLQP